MEPAYRRLKIWKKAHQLALDVAHATNDFPEEQIEGLGLELRKDAVEVNGAIANGYAVPQRSHLKQQLSRAEQALTRLEVRLQVAADLGYLDALESEHLLRSCSDVDHLVARQFVALRSHHG